MAVAKKTATAAKAAETSAVKNETVRKAAPKKETAAKAPEAKEPAAKEPAAKKTAAKKAEPIANVVIEFAGKQVVAKEVLAAATKAYTEAHTGAEIKTIDIYVKPEESVAYYVVNGEGSDDFKVELS